MNIHNQFKLFNCIRRNVYNQVFIENSYNPDILLNIGRDFVEHENGIVFLNLDEAIAEYELRVEDLSEPEKEELREKYKDQEEFMIAYVNNWEYMEILPYTDRTFIRLLEDYNLTNRFVEFITENYLTNLYVHTDKSLWGYVLDVDMLEIRNGELQFKNNQKVLNMLDDWQAHELFVENTEYSLKFVG